MIVGMYTSASGMLAEGHRHEAIANNLANVSTTGFKRDTTLIRSHPVQMLHRLSDQMIGIGGQWADMVPAIGARGQGAIIESIQPDFTQGTLLETFNATDVAIQGEGFFMVDTVHGRRYTRQGNFALDGRGRLVTQNGDPVLTTVGNPVVVGRRKLEIMGDGSLQLDGVAAGRLAVVLPQDRGMVFKEGAGMYASAAGARFRPATGATVAQGRLERANVNAVTEMVEMLEALRSYEANQRAIVAQDETLNTLITQVGRFA